MVLEDVNTDEVVFATACSVYLFSPRCSDHIPHFACQLHRPNVRLLMLRCLQRGVLSIAGASVGVGLGVTTWSPWLCLLPNDNFPAAVWVQVGVLASTFPIALLAAAYSQPFARAIWKRTKYCSLQSV